MADHKDFYIHNGDKYYSVTTILKVINRPKLNQLRGAKGNDWVDNMLEETSTIGKLFHAEAKKIISENGFYTIKDELLKQYGMMVMEFEKWTLENIVDVKENPGRLYSGKHKYCGEIDDIYLLKAKKEYDLIDIKTGTTRHYVEAMQLAGYKNLLEENGIKVKDRIILVCSRDGKPVKPIKIESDYKTDLYNFLYAKQLYLYCNKLI